MVWMSQYVWLMSYWWSRVHREGEVKFEWDEDTYKIIFFYNKKEQV